MAVFGLYTFIGIYGFFRPYQDREIMGSATISSSWLEIVPKEPLRAEQVVQQVVLYVRKPVKQARDSWELILPDGSQTIPEVELVDQDGRTYYLTEPSAIASPGSDEAFQRGFGAWQLPKDKVYRLVRLRSDKPIPVSKIVWRSYDPQNRK
jgi:hypothetical protein